MGNSNIPKEVAMAGCRLPAAGRRIDTRKAGAMLIASGGKIDPYG